MKRYKREIVGWRVKVLRGWCKGVICIVIQSFSKTAVVKLIATPVKSTPRMYIRVAISSLKKLSW
ncbi:MAG: hypothetical protein ACKERG_01320 [Candidatus Hodgkinia cicadicola]